MNIYIIIQINDVENILHLLFLFKADLLYQDI